MVIWWPINKPYGEFSGVFGGLETNLVCIAAFHVAETVGIVLGIF